MNRLKYLCILIVVSAFTIEVSAKTRDLKIVVEPSERSGFLIRVSCLGSIDGTTKFVLPNEWGGQRDLSNATRIVGVSPKHAIMEDTPVQHVKTIKHRPGERLTLTYLLSQDFEGPLNTSLRYRPVIDPQFIHWIGSTVWILPDWEDSTEVDLKFEWKGLPSNWSIANSFGTGSRSQHFKSTLGALRSSIWVAGDFRILTAQALGKTVNVAIRGRWLFSDRDLSEMIRLVIETERKFWNDDSQEYFLVTLVPIFEGANAYSFGGTGLTDSFALFATQNATIDRIRGLLAHEYAHNWIPTKLGRMPEPEQELYWFSEGFTEFYTYRLLFRGGLISQEELVNIYNGHIREYYSLPVKTAPNERILKDFWNDRDVQRLPYLRGFLFATNLDASIRRSSEGKRSLDDVMLRLAREFGLKPRTLSFEYLAELFSDHLNADPRPLMKRQMIDGELISPDAEALGKDVALVTVGLPVFELGFDLDKFSKDRIVEGVDPKSAAYAAGLRNGQKRTGGFSLMFGDTSRTIELKVADHEGEKTIKYLPVAAETIALPQYRLR